MTIPQTVNHSCEFARAVVFVQQSLFREGLASILERAGVRVTAITSSLTDAYTRAQSAPGTVLLAQMNEGLSEFLRELPQHARNRPDLDVLLLSRSLTSAEIATCLAAGIRGLISEDANGDQLVTAITTLQGGRVHVNLEPAEPVPDPAVRALTEREWHVLELIARGQTNRQIAGSLFVSLRTVESTRARIKRKSGCTTRSELVAFYRDNQRIAPVCTLHAMPAGTRLHE